MRCSDFDQRVNVLLDQRLELAQDEDLLNHAAVCASCSKHLQSYQDVLSVVPELALPVAKDSSRTNSSSKTNRMTYIASVISLAVALLLCVSLWPEHNELDHVVAAPTQVPPIRELVAKDVVETNQLRIAPSDTFANYSVHQPLIGLRLLTIGDWSKTSIAAMPFGADMPQLEKSWLDAMSAGITPVTETVNSTIDVLRRTLTLPTKTVNG